MIYQASGLLPNQTVFDFSQTTEKIFTGNQSIMVYSTPFSFYVNGNSNLYGYRVEIYRNDDNSLVYDSGIITKAIVASADENETSVSPYTEEYNVFPLKQGDNIDIGPILPSGENVKVNIYLDTSVNNRLNINSDTEYNNRTYNWVLKQYYVKKSTGEVDVTRYVRNANTFFVAKEQLFIGVKAFVYDALDNIIIIDDLLDVKDRQVYFEGKLLNFQEGYTLGNPSSYEIMATRWVVELINITDTSQNVIQQDTGWVVTSNLNFSFDGFLKLEGDAWFYQVHLYVRFKYGGENFIKEVGQVLSNDSIREGDLIIQPTYAITDISSALGAIGEVCQKENYAQLSWDATGITGRFYDNDERLAGKDLNSRFINISLGYDATDDNINNKTSRFLTALRVNNYNNNGKIKNEYVIYSNEFLRNFVIKYNTQQIILRVCNFSNIFTQIPVPEENSNIIIVKDSVKNGVILKIGSTENSYSYYRLLAIEENGSYYYALQYVVNGQQEGYWDTKVNGIPITNATSNYWTTLCLNLATDIDQIEGDYNCQRITVLESLFTSMAYSGYEETVNYGAVNSFRDINMVTGNDSVIVENPNAGFEKNEADSYATSGLPYYYSENFAKVPHYVIEIQGIVENTTSTVPSSNGLYIDSGSNILYSYEGAWIKQRNLGDAIVDDQGNTLKNEDICYVNPKTSVEVAYVGSEAVTSVSCSDEEVFKEMVQDYGTYIFVYSKQGSNYGWKLGNNNTLISNQELLENYGINCIIKDGYSPEVNIDTITVTYQGNYRFYIFTNDNKLCQVINYVTPLWNEDNNIPYIISQDQTASWKVWEQEPLTTVYPFATRDEAEKPEYNSIILYNGLFNYLGVVSLGEQILELVKANSDLQAYYRVDENVSYSQLLYKILGKELLPIYETVVEDKVNTRGFPMLYYLPGAYILAHFFDRTLQGLDLTMGGEAIEYWEIDRIDAFTGTTQRAAKIESSYNTLIDYLVPNNWEGYYTFSAITRTKKGNPIIVKRKDSDIDYNLKTNWWNYALIILSEPDFTGTREVEEVFYWENNISTDAMTNNTSYNVQETLSQFKRITKSKTDAMSGSLQSLMGCISGGVYIQDSVEIMDKLRAAQMSNKVKILKDRNGKNYVIEFTSPITYTYDNKAALPSYYKNNNNMKNIVIQPTSIKINWLEIDKIDSVTGVKLQ